MGRKGRQRKTIQLRRWAGKRAGTGGKVADRGGAWAVEDGRYEWGGIGTGKRTGDQSKRWRGRRKRTTRRGVDGGEVAAEAVVEAAGRGGGRVECASGRRRRVRGGRQAVKEASDVSGQRGGVQEWVGSGGLLEVRR